MPTQALGVFLYAVPHSHEPLPLSDSEGTDPYQGKVKQYTMKQ